jgi:hypothetical protein
MDALSGRSQCGPAGGRTGRPARLASLKSRIGPPALTPTSASVRTGRQWNRCWPSRHSNESLARSRRRFRFERQDQQFGFGGGQLSYQQAVVVHDFRLGDRWHRLKGIGDALLAGVPVMPLAPQCIGKSVNQKPEIRFCGHDGCPRDEPSLNVIDGARRGADSGGLVIIRPRRRVRQVSFKKVIGAPCGNVHRVVEAAKRSVKSLFQGLDSLE